MMMVSRSLVFLGMAGLGLAALAGCSRGDDPVEATTGVGTAPSQSSSIVPVAGESLAPEPTPVDVAAAFADVNGRWCPTSPPSWGEVCVTVSLPTELHDGDDDPTHVTYVYPWDSVDASDPTTFNAADYAFPPNLGECWTALLDGYPPMSGTEFMYCPATALAGIQWIDDPASWPDSLIEPGYGVPDYRDQDRLYEQQVTLFPYIRASA